MNWLAALFSMWIRTLTQKSPSQFGLVVTSRRSTLPRLAYRTSMQPGLNKINATHIFDELSSYLFVALALSDY